MANDSDTIVVNTQPRWKKGGVEEKMAQGKVSHHNTKHVRSRNFALPRMRP